MHSDTRRVLETVVILAMLLTPCRQPARAAGTSYVVVVSGRTFVDPDWRPVVETLAGKHNADILTWDIAVSEVLGPLARIFPRYACFICPPEEATREFVRDVHRLVRRLDDDPYPDVIWAILTGYDAENALQIARCAEPLVARRLLTATVGAPLDSYDAGVMFNELQPNVFWRKTASGVEKMSCPTDTTEMIVSALNNEAPDVFITSGHATERDWLPGYGYRSGIFRCDKGGLYAVDTHGRRHDVASPNLKIHLAIGNCLIAHIPDGNCMALALMRSAGVRQMLGYTIPTGNGYGGWGVKDYFSELQAGRFTLAEAHYANTLALVYELEKRSLNTDAAADSHRGLPGDRDTVVLYGDPAWPARMPPRALPWTQTITHENGRYRFIIGTRVRGDWDNRPVIELLPHRIQDIHIVEGADLEPVIGDNFILVAMRNELLSMKGNRGEELPIRGDFEEGERFQITFTASRIPSR